MIKKWLKIWRSVVIFFILVIRTYVVIFILVIMQVGIALISILGLILFGYTWKWLKPAIGLYLKLENLLLWKATNAIS